MFQIRVLGFWANSDGGKPARLAAKVAQNVESSRDFLGRNTHGKSGECSRCRTTRRPALQTRRIISSRRAAWRGGGCRDRGDGGRFRGNPPVFSFAACRIRTLPPGRG